MVWIHGGSFETGQGSGYDATALAVRGGVVVVTINYRLNVFGFLCTDDENAPGNYGLLDQQLALQWVHDNIAAFGGDPSRVTLFGQSAGGAAVMSHLTAPRSRPLFQRVIAHSGISPGSFGLAYQSRQRSSQRREFAERIAQKAGCMPRDRATISTRHLVACLREKPVRVVLMAGLAVAREEIVPRVWTTVLDDDFYPATSRSSTRYSFRQFDTVTGVTSGDGSPLLELLPEIIHRRVNQDTGLSQADFDAIVPVFVPGSDDPLSRRAINFEYTDWSAPRRSLDRLVEATDILLDNNFLHGISLFFRSVYQDAGSRRMFVFDHRSAPRQRYPWLVGAPHSEELSYVFGLPFNGSGIGHLFTDEERRLSDRMITYWSNIAKTGDPNVNPDLNTTGQVGNLTYWPQYGDTETYLLIQLNDSTVGQGYRKDKVKFWTDYLPKLSDAATEYCQANPMPGAPSTASPDCGELYFGEGLGLKLTRQQAETLIEVFMFLVIALVAFLILIFGAVMGYKYRYKESRKASLKEKGGARDTNGEINKLAAFEVNEGFTESEDTKM